jgi:hypothetical protein
MILGVRSASQRAEGVVHATDISATRTAPRSPTTSRSGAVGSAGGRTIAGPNALCTTSIQ